MRKLLALTLALGLLAACTGSNDEVGRGKVRRGGTALGGELATFDSCDELADYAADQAEHWWGQGGGRTGLRAMEQSAAAGDDSAALDTAAGPVPTTAAAGADFSGTNNQEVGVDEADVVKTDGELVLTTTDGTLRVIDATEADPRLVGSLDLPDGGPHELLLQGDRLLVLSPGATIVPPDQQQGSELPGSYASATVLTEVDVSDPTDPVVVGTKQVDGTYRTARSAEGVARIVVVSEPMWGGPMPLMTEDGTFDAEAAQERSADEWLPAVTVVGDDGSIERTPLVGCADVSRPVSDSALGGAGTVTVLSVDLTQPLDDVQAVSVMGNAEHVYASSDNLYLAASVWDESEGDGGTEIHQLSLEGAGPATYVASGSVSGHPLNQFAFSEHDGRLRVATTEDNWGGGGEMIAAEGGSDSAIAILERSGDQLDEVGRVDGMGKGEQIYSVRFLGDQAYVVTFRQTDPLYTVDLSDPAAPAVVGELKIPGYSAYLHPVGDGLLLGVGQDADEGTGRTRGTQVSLFDVSDLAAPARLQQFTMPSGSSDTEYDHRAFLWWAEDGLAVIPHNGYDRGWSYNAALGLDVSAEGITERGRVTHDAEPGSTPIPRTPAPCPPDASCAVPVDVTAGGGYIVRSLVVNGDQLWTVSELGIEISDVDTLTEESWISFTS